MYCPNCGKQHVVAGDSQPNGGELFVAEDMEGCTEFYDAARPYKCNDCETQFYMGAD
jgi:hypothetical protein